MVVLFGCHRFMILYQFFILTLSPTELFWLMDISYQLVLVKKKNGVATEVAQWL